MKFTEKTVLSGGTEFLASAKYECIAHTFEADTKAGALVEITDGTGAKFMGINLYDVVVADNPNGAVVVKGIILTDKLPTKPTSTDKMFPTLIFK